MNLHKMSRIAKVSIGSVAMVFGLASCSLDYVVGYVYMTEKSPDVISEYSIDFQSGALTAIGTVTAGSNPVKLVADPTGKFVYVINQGDSTVQEFAVQGDGTLVSKNTYPTGKTPTAIAIDPQGAFLYVTYNSGYTVAAPVAGGVSIFPVNADNSLGTALAPQAVGNNPVGINVSYFNHFVYVVDQDPANPTVLGFSQNTSTGALAALPGTSVAGGATTGYAAGVSPSALTEDLTARFVYVTDAAANQLIGYTVSSNGSLVPMKNGPFPTAQLPVAITVDPTGKLLYVVNQNSYTVQGFAIDTFTGTPSGAGGSVGSALGPGPTCVAIDPSLGTFLFTSNSLDNSITGEHLSPNTGSLSVIQNSPFQGSTTSTPTCLTAVPAGPHASQFIAP